MREKLKHGAEANDSAVWSELIDQSGRIGRLEADNVATKATLAKVVERGTFYMGPQGWMKVGAGLAFLGLILWDRAPGLAKLALKLAGVPSGLIGS
jgi:hypothetical protein